MRPPRRRLDSTRQMELLRSPRSLRWQCPLSTQSGHQAQASMALSSTARALFWMNSNRGAGSSVGFRDRFDISYAPPDPVRGPLSTLVDGHQREAASTASPST
jgi:hypothetical protein